MGLAAWAAVAGGAKGAEKGIDVEVERENARIDEQRQMRIEKLKDQMASRRDEANRSFQGEQNRLQREAQKGIVEVQEEGATSRAELTVGGAMDRTKFTADSQKSLQEADQEFRAAEGRLDRELKRDLATLASSAAENKRLQERFQPKTLSVKEASKMGLEIEVDKPAIFDEKDGRWYIQEGNRYVLPGAEIKIPGQNVPVPGEESLTPAQIQEARAAMYGEALTTLYTEPDSYGEFLETFGWLPADFFAGQGYTARSSSASSSETTARE